MVWGPRSRRPALNFRVSEKVPPARKVPYDPSILIPLGINGGSSRPQQMRNRHMMIVILYHDHHGTRDHEVVMIIVIIWSSFIILASFWSPCGGIFEAFWGHVDLQNHLGSSLRALFVVEVDFLGSTPPILAGFAELLGKFLEIFRYLLSI